MNTVKLTFHSEKTNSETGKTYNGHHNDRNFDLSHAENIDPSRSSQNRYIVFHDNKPFEVTHRLKDGQVVFENHCRFIDHELSEYRKLFESALSAQNKRNSKSGHSKRNITIEMYFTSGRTAPEEIVLYLGDKDHHVSAPELFEIFLEFVNEIVARFGNNIKFLDAALHMDEEGAPHIHIRRVYVGAAKGHIVASQEAALRALGIQRPNPNKPSGQYNNAKQSFTQIERDIITSICKAHDIQIEEPAKRSGKKSKKLNDYIIETQEKKILDKEHELNELEQRHLELSERVEAKKKALLKLVKDTIDRALDGIKSFFAGASCRSQSALLAKITALPLRLPTGFIVDGRDYSGMTIADAMSEARKIDIKELFHEKGIPYIAISDELIDRFLVSLEDHSVDEALELALMPTAAHPRER